MKQRQPRSALLAFVALGQLSEEGPSLGSQRFVLITQETSQGDEVQM